MSFHKIRIICAVLTAVLMLTACGRDTDGQGEAESLSLQMQEEPSLDYEVPKMQPGILVNRRGYDAASRKVAVLRGENLPEDFRLVDTSTGEVVYTGSLGKKGYNEVYEEYNSYGDFSEFTQTGEYYIECGTVGRSYPFQIQEGLTSQVFGEVLDYLKAQAEAGMKTGEPEGNGAVQEDGYLLQEKQELLKQIIILLLSYELYPEVYEDTDGNQAPDILDTVTMMIQDISRLQDIKTGEIYGCEYTYAAALAKYSYLYQRWDSRYATEILNLADKAWRCAEKEKEDRNAGDMEYRILAAAELYRANGRYQYRAVIEAYGAGNVTVSGNSSVSGSDSLPGGDVASPKSNGERLAEVTYLSTRQKVDVALCGRFMKDLMEEAEEIAAQASDSYYFSAAGDTRDGIEKLIWDMVALTVVEYVITNHEYGQVIENQHHFLNGRNPEAYCYWMPLEDEGKAVAESGPEIEGTAEQMRLTDSRVWTAGYLLMLSEMLANQ